MHLPPIWGLSLDYYYFPLKAENTIPSQVNISTFMHTGALNATINFTRLIFPETKSRLYINGSIGLGYAYYEYYPIDRITGSTPVNVILDNGGKKLVRLVPYLLLFRVNTISVNLSRSE